MPTRRLAALAAALASALFLGNCGGIASGPTPPPGGGGGGNVRRPPVGQDRSPPATSANAASAPSTPARCSTG